MHVLEKYDHNIKPGDKILLKKMTAGSTYGYGCTPFVEGMANDNIVTIDKILNNKRTFTIKETGGIYCKDMIHCIIPNDLKLNIYKKEKKRKVYKEELVKHKINNILYEYRHVDLDDTIGIEGVERYFLGGKK